MTTPLLKLLSNTKTRTLVLLIGGMLLTGIIIAIVSSGKTGEPIEKHVSKTTEVPKGVESTPGAKASDKYIELQSKANIIGSKKAEKKGGTFIPTIVADKKIAVNEELQNQFLKALDQTTDISKIQKTASQTLQESKLAQLLAQQKQDDEAMELLNKQRQSQLNADRMAAINEQKSKAIETVSQAMEEQSKVAFNAWNDVPQQSYNAGEWELKAKQNAADNNTTVDNRPVIMKAGTILFATLETSVNSDEPGPIMAKIIYAPFKDAKLIGKIELPQGEGEKITLQFDTLNIPTEASSSKINAVAIDPDTARTALASKVDHHYLLRWGTLFGSAFLSGYAKAVSRSGTQVQTTTGAVGTNTVTNTPKLTGRQQIFEGLGEIGTKWSNQLGQIFNRKPTITITSGTGIGILILSDVKLGAEPVSQKDQTQITNTEQQKSANSTDLLNTITQNAAKINQVNNQTLTQNASEATKSESSYTTTNMQETK